MNYCVSLGRTLQRAIDAQVDMDQGFFEGCFKIKYDCLKLKWSQHTSFEPIISLRKQLGCAYFEGLNVNTAEM